MTTGTPSEPSPVTRPAAAAARSATGTNVASSGRAERGPARRSPSATPGCRRRRSRPRRFLGGTARPWVSVITTPTCAPVARSERARARAEHRDLPGESDGPRHGHRRRSRRRSRRWPRRSRGDGAPAARQAAPARRAWTPAGPARPGAHPSRSGAANSTARAEASTVAEPDHPAFRLGDDLARHHDHITVLERIPSSAP